MHPMNLGLGLALLLHVAAGMSPAHKAQLDAFRAQLEAKEAQSQAGLGVPGARVNPKFSGLVAKEAQSQAGAVAQDNPEESKLEQPSTTDDGLSSSTTTAGTFVNPSVSSTTSAVIQPEPEGPQTHSKLGQLVKAVFEKLRSGKGISMIVDVKNLEEFIQS